MEANPGQACDWAPVMAMAGIVSDVPIAPPPRPKRALDTVSMELLENLVDENSLDRALVKSRDFLGFEVKPEDIHVVLYDAHSVDSFAACVAARSALGSSAKYEGVTRVSVADDLQVDVTGRVVAMLGFSWPLDAMHDLAREVDMLLVLETHMSAIRELSHFNYDNVRSVIDTDMSAGPLAYNLFHQGQPVPPLLRALEDAELGRHALRHADAFADGFLAAHSDVKPPRGEIFSNDPQMAKLRHMMDEERGLPAIDSAVEEGLALSGSIQQQCEVAVAQCMVRTMRTFPAFRCACAQVPASFAGRAAEMLVTHLATEGGMCLKDRCFGAAFEVRPRRWTVWVELRSLANGPDVSEIAAAYGGSGRPTRAFFEVESELWEDLWIKPEPILWDVRGGGAQCPSLRRGELVTILRRGERFRESPFDEWSWGYTTGTVEGWIPTLAHTVFVATKSIPSPDLAQSLEEGDLLVARGQRGKYLWGSKCRPSRIEGRQWSWFPYKDDSLRPVHVERVKALLAGTEGV